MKKVTDAEAVKMLKSEKTLSNLKIEGHFSILSICEKSLMPDEVKEKIVISNCEFENLFIGSVNYQAEVLIDHCLIHNHFGGTGSFYLRPFILKNCEIRGVAHFDASGFFSFAWFEGNNFHDIAYFTDDNFTSLAVFRNNYFQKGTNILGGKTIRSSFAVEPIFIGNAGQLDLEID